MIYLDNAATTIKKPPQVAAAVVAAMGAMGNSARGTHSQALDAARTVYEARCRLARLFNCSRPERVVFAVNSTEALNMAICGLIGKGDHVITTDLEHNSVLRPLYRLEAERGVSLSFVAADKQGCVDYSEFEGLIRPETRAIVCTHASNLTGNELALERISEVAHRNGLLLIVDASQTAGCRPIDMERMQIDVLCFTGHKGLLGPQGTGGLCIRPGVEIRPFAVGGTGVHSFLPTQPEAYPTRLEAGTLNGHGLAGLDAALDYIEQEGKTRLREKELFLARKFYEGVRCLPGVTVYGDWSAPERCPIVTLNIGDYDSGEVSDELAERFSIATRPGAHCAPRLHTALGTAEQGAVRFSWSCMNTEEETEAAIAAVRTLAEEA